MATDPFRLGLLVNNAGAPTPSGEEVATDEQFDAAFALNVHSIYRLAAFITGATLHVDGGMALGG
ncbi:hypothetical protein [Vitiosangium sp. GDMCC 1.1324]|uniref:hypothetical protein n=1 Tax=Vitiosangium sp. (strain GDMCC 1.1324) TaxID=2138576 RepID=UPI000D3D6402|nr:hypothetical protein [Vitiosangium sp. GDMCC 1.1324]PTL82242.1 hypothetical protein DAT35_20860 [Vitiosangium sp. GDMCC 1.1324]